MTLREAVSYLDGRYRQVFDTPSSYHPKWTNTDAHALRIVLQALRGVMRRRGELL
jgi:hypothetical protein